MAAPAKDHSLVGYTSNPSTTSEALAKEVGWAALVLLALAAFVFRRHLFSGYTFPWDFLGPYSKTPAYISEMIRAGQFSAWIPFEGGGSSLAINPQSGLHFPLWWAFGLLGLPATLKAVTFVQIAHVVFGALGVFILARARRIEAPWAMAAAVAYLFFGGFYGNAQHADLVRGFSYLPWILWALTIPPWPRRWIRLLCLPGLFWVTASGAYPGQTVSFSLVSATYVAGELWLSRSRPDFKKILVLVGAAGLASAGVVAAIVVPYLAASRAGLLFRPKPVTAAVRAASTLGLDDLLGLYLNSFALNFEGTMQVWFLGAPILIGLAGIRLIHLRRHLSLVNAGVLALVLCTIPAWLPAGRLMLAVPFLFPSRFPAGDYKAAVAICLIILSVEGWRHMIVVHRAPAVVIPIAAALAIGPLVAPSVTSAPLTRTPFLLGMVIALSALLALRPFRIKLALMVPLLIGLIVLDGVRSTRDSFHWIGASPWLTLPRASEIVPTRAHLEGLNHLLRQPPARRPPRRPPAVSVHEIPNGVNQDALGYVGFGYFAADYGGTITLPRRRAAVDANYSRIMHRPWTAWTFPCEADLCTRSAIDMPNLPWDESSGIMTTRYGTSSIDYVVRLAQPSLMIENELALPGWSADKPEIRAVDVGGIFRGWVLPAGDYSFTASYRQPQLTLQLILVVLSISAWLLAAALVRRSAPATS